MPSGSKVGRKLLKAAIDPLRIFILFLGLFMLIFPFNLAHAQLFDANVADQPIALIADRIDVDSENRIIVAEGSVQVYHGRRTLTATRIEYRDETGQIFADGPITLRDPSGITVFASSAELDRELINGLVRGARSVMGEHIRLAAVEARRTGGRFNTLSKAVYSPCKVCADDPTPLWRIRARRIIHDEEDRIIHYESATFDVFGVPVAWLPYFRHPDPTVTRASGFLVPRFLSSSTFGYAIKQPYFWAISPHADLTFTPFFTTDDGLILEGEYRRAFRNGELRLSGSITQNDYTGGDGLHGHVDTEGLFALTDKIDWGWDITFASDDGYLNRFDFNYGDRLSSEVFVRSYREDGYFDIAGVYFQSLRDSEPAGAIPLGLPVIDARYGFDESWLDGRINLSLSGYAVRRNNGRDVARISIGADWERQVVLPFGLSLTGFASARADAFTVHQDPAITKDLVTRMTGLAGVEARFPLVGYSGTVTHVFEPIAQAIVAPFGGNGADVPFEDSIVTEFDETNVVDRNHFSGLDNVEEGPRLNLLVRYERIAQDGLRFDASIGRAFRLKAQNAFSAGSGLSDNESDFVTSWQASYDPYFSIRHRMRFSDDFEITRNEFFGDFAVERFELSLGYIFLEADPAVGALTDREEVDARAKFGLDDEWSLSAFLQRDLQTGEFVEFGGGLSYQNECCSIDLVVKRRGTNSTSSPASTSVGVQIRLLTLGSNEQGL